LSIEYGSKGGTKSTYNWTGSLSFLESAIVALPSSDWGSWPAPDEFEVTVSHPNGGLDEYAANDHLSVPFVRPPEYPAHFFIQFQTNAAAYESSYELLDAAGNVVFARGGMTNDTTYRDTLQLPDGCYRLVIHDSGEDGLSFFANNDGTGSVRLREVGGGYFKIFEPNFGSEIAQSFTVGYTVGTDEPDHVEVFSAYPNPTSGQVVVDVQLASADDVEVAVIDVFGKEIRRQTLRLGRGELEFDLGSEAKGLYFIVLMQRDEVRVSKVMLQ
jgi:hypothetical protein